MTERLKYAMLDTMFIEMLVATALGGAIFALGFFLGAREREPSRMCRIEGEERIVTPFPVKKSDIVKPKTSVWTQDEGERARLEAVAEEKAENMLPHPVEKK